VKFSIEEQMLSRNVERFQGGLVFQSHRLWYHSALGSRVLKKKKKYLEGLGELAVSLALLSLVLLTQQRLVKLEFGAENEGV